MQTGEMSTRREVIGAGLGRIPSGCAILTVQDESRSTGVLVSWVQQASFDPPSVSVALRKGRPAGEMVEKSGRFLLNIIGTNPTALFKHFGKGFSPDEDAFGGLSVSPSSFGMRIHSCIAHLGCRMTQRVAVGDHDLYIGTVEAAGEMGQVFQPYVHIRSSGFSY